MSEQARGRSPVVTLMYEGWQVWDGHYWPVRVGGDVVASIEFVQRSAPHPVEPGAPLHLEHIDSFRYLATARVLDTTDAVVLDLGSFRALRWVRPGEGPGDFETGAAVSLELNLGLNGWPDSPWTNRAADRYGTEHHWHVERILRVTTGRDDATEIDEAAMETVDSVNQYCLLECSLVD
jgi:hypothetical protein